MELPPAESLNYWKTSRTSPDSWIDKACRQIEKVGGEVLGSQAVIVGDRAGFQLAFRMDDEDFRVDWPVCPSEKGDVRAARIQAATMLYHDVKSRALSSLVLGARISFFAYRILNNGRTAAQLEGLEDLPKLLGDGT